MGHSATASGVLIHRWSLSKLPGESMPCDRSPAPGTRRHGFNHDDPVLGRDALLHVAGTDLRHLRFAPVIPEAVT